MDPPVPIHPPYTPYPPFYPQGSLTFRAAYDLMASNAAPRRPPPLEVYLDVCNRVPPVLHHLFLGQEGWRMGRLGWLEQLGWLVRLGWFVRPLVRL